MPGPGAWLTTRASWKNRSTIAASSESEDRTTLIAARRPRSVCSARYTVPIPPSTELAEEAIRSDRPSSRWTRRGSVARAPRTRLHRTHVSGIAVCERRQQLAAFSAHRDVLVQRVHARRPQTTMQERRHVVGIETRFHADCYIY